MRILLTYILLITVAIAYSQDEKKFIRDGNKKFDQQKFNDAEIAYRKGLDKNSNSFESAFNLGDALYKQGKYPEASTQFQSLTNRELSKEDKANVYYNLGNSLLKEKKYKESIEAYKQALRDDANDMDSKYNLSYAMKMLKQQQQQQQQNQDNKDNKDQKKDQQQQQQQQKEQQKKDEQKQQQQQQQQQKQEISKEDAERMLKSMDNDEKNLQEKLKQV
jgi:tetratricopeptide (TPR) repeat protein